MKRITVENTVLTQNNFHISGSDTPAGCISDM